MRAVVQRVARASVVVDGETVGAVGRGALVLLGVMRGDDRATAERLAEKVALMRFHPDGKGHMNLSTADLVADGQEAGLLVVSQFTLAADGRKGRRPSFDRAAPPEDAEPLYGAFCTALRETHGIPVSTGRFGAHMQVELVNDGPATFVLDIEPPGAS